MKKMNRREFLALTGAAVVALSLAGCDDAPPAPPAPPAAPTSKEAELVAAINKVWKKKYEANEVTHEQLILNQDAVDVISAYGHICEKANETPHIPTADDFTMISEGSGKFKEKMKKYGNSCFAGMAGVTTPFANKVIALEDAYSCEDTAVQAFVKKLLTSLFNSSKAEYISIYLPVVQGKTYMTAAIFLNDKA